MTELFKGYEEEFINSLSATNKKIQSISVQSSHKKQMAFVDIKQDLTECEKTLKHMETEMNSLDVQIKFQYSRKVRGYKKDYDDCRKKLYKAEEDFAYEKNRQMLMGAQLDVHVDFIKEEKGHRGKQKLLKNGQLLSDATQKLRGSVKVMHETEDISNNVQVELVDQSQKMKRNKEKLLEMRDDLGHSEHKIKNIMGRIRRNKLILGVVLGSIALIGIIVLIVHFVN